MKWAALLLLVALPSVAFPAADAGFVALPGGNFRSALKYKDVPGGQRVPPFALMRRPVTNGEFLGFVTDHPQWRRDRVPAVFAESRYLSHWAGPLKLGDKVDAQQPVTWVSWFAAKAYCEAQGSSLPAWSQWEYAAAADESRRDARGDPAWRQRILAWYSRPSNQALPRAGLQAPNVYGVQDLHGMVWEWTEDYASMLVSDDSRSQNDAGAGKFCGGGALSTNDLDNYAVLMRVAMLSSLEASNGTANLGFRCAKDNP